MNVKIETYDFVKVIGDGVIYAVYVDDSKKVYEIEECEEHHR